jgi:thiamine biosynthesis lipoprotein
MNNKFVFSLLGFIALLLSGVFIFKSISDKPINADSNRVSYIHNEGQAQGTTYSATYLQPQGIDLQLKIDSAFRDFDTSLSTYNANSVISQINRNVDSVTTDYHFEQMFTTAMEVSANTNGAFDITVGPLVKAWGFAFGNSDHTKIPDVKKLLPYIGYKKVKLVNHKVLKENPNVLIDANAIAQGYSADVMGALLEKYGCKNYVFEIGGEVVCKGLNEKGQKWRIGIDKPIDDSTGVTKEIQTVLSISDIAVTTSGNYRKYYYKDGKKYAHHIDPRTGQPIVHNLLSVTVIAPKCMLADAYACSFMVVGMDSAMKVYKSVPGMECYFVYVDSQGKNQVKYTSGFKKFLSY